jgi:hypothetical protein
MFLADLHAKIGSTLTLNINRGDIDRYRKESQNKIIYTVVNVLNIKVSRIDGASITIIVCLHVLVARRILLILDMLISFSEYRCLKR